MPTLKFIKTFQIAARKSSFKLAADDLHVTASAVSHQIKLLEEQLGLTLFERGAHSLHLTEAGAHYLESIDDLFVRLELATEQLRLRHHRLAVRVMAPPFFANELLLPKLSEFSEAHPTVDMHVSTRTSLNDMHAAGADVSIICGDGQWPSMVKHLLFTQRVVVACAPQLLRLRKVHVAEDLGKESLIVDTRRLDLWDRWAASQGKAAIRPRQEIRLDSMSAAVQAAELGVGFALVSAPLAARKFQTGTLERVFEAELITGDAYYLVARPDDADRPAVRALIDWASREFGAREEYSSSPLEIKIGYR
jgi:LysR family transcriptional regulator, glycine cleavage system transcriptional activator